MTIYIQYHQTRIGEFIIGVYQQQLCLLDFRYRKMRDTVDGRLKRLLATDFNVQQTQLHLQVITQLDEYLLGERSAFDFPLLLVGSEFQTHVWHALQAVSYGSTVSYSDLAKAINRPDAVRAVAAANGANALAIVVPCHRVIGSNGELVGYGGGLAVKEKLLQLERLQLFLLGE